MDTQDDLRTQYPSFTFKICTGKKVSQEKKNSKSENSFEMLILHRSDENETTDTKQRTDLPCQHVFFLALNMYERKRSRTRNDGANNMSQTTSKRRCFGTVHCKTLFSLAPLEGEGIFFKTHIQPVPCLCTLLDLIVTSSLMPRGNSIGTCKTHERCLSRRLQLTRIDSGGTLSFFLI